jgi:NAD(P)-dependent dehydrogenase (short-subunit alcohol dehydrogenase family)
VTGTVSTAVDRLLDRSVVLGYSRIGLALRRRMQDHPADPLPGSLRGQHTVVTGASSGLGVATAVGLARLGADVHLVVRDLGKGEQVAAEIRAEVPGARLHLHRCDVSDLDDVRRFAAELGAQVDSLAALVHNAGAMPPERTESAQGHEMTMALHVLGPILMTESLLPSLEAGRGRVVLVTSGGMYTQQLPADDPDYEHGDYRPPVAYARSKRVQVSLLPTLAERWGPHGVSVNAMHPGWADTPGVVDSLPGFHKLTGPILRDAEQGADTSVWLCAAEPAPEAGLLWHDRRPRPPHYARRTHETEQERLQIWEWVRGAAGLDT